MNLPDAFKNSKRISAGSSAIFLLLMMFLTLPGCKSQKITQEEPVVEKRPQLVRTMTISNSAEIETRSFPVFSREGQTAKISFRVPGQLLNFDLKLGQKVKKDEVLAVLDQRDYILAVELIKEKLVEARAGLKAMKTGARTEDISSLEAQLTAASSNLEQAEKQYKRMENLKKDGTVSDVQFDMSKATRDTALAARNTLESQLAKAKKGSRQEEIEMVEAKIAGLEIDLTLAKNKLADTELKAPFDGVISEKFFDNHEMVAPGIPVLTLVDINTIEAILSVPKEIVLRKNDIKKITCEFDLPEKVRFDAKIKELGQSVQQGNLAYPLTITFNVDEKAPGRVLSGMTGTALIDLAGGTQKIVIPSAALLTRKQGKQTNESSVFIVDKDKKTVSLRPVKPGLLSNSGVVIESGLKEGDLVVIAGARFLHEGQEIRLEQ